MHQYITSIQQKLKGAGIDTAELDARLLLMHVLGVSREELMFADKLELSDQQQLEFDTLLGRRANREPLSHILGVREFYGREFKVSSDVLDPRPDTETLIDAVLESRIENLESSKETSNILDSKFSILDIGTGSGCIIITLLKEIQRSRGVAMDISKAALTVAQGNALTHQVDNRLTFIEGSLFGLCSNMSGLDGNRFDVIVSNPPYIKTSDMATLMPEVLNYEPHLALDGGKDGLDCYESLAKSLAQLLKPPANGCGGLIFLEIGAGQRDDVVRIFSASNWQLVAIHRDLAGHERCVSFKRESEYIGA